MIANLLLLTTAAIWGFGFVAQVLGMNYLEPFAFIGARFVLGALSLLPVIWYLRRRETPTGPGIGYMTFASCALGAILFAASSFQQVGLLYTTASNAGFITGMYMVFVPIFGLMLGMATGLVTWVGCIVAAFGLYLLGVDDQYQMGYGDLLQLAGAGIWALHILAIDHFTKHAPGVQLACGQFVVCSALGIFVSIVFAGESTAWSQLLAAGPTLVYAGIITVGVAYTLQIVAQARANPVHAGIILSLEAVFGAIGGYLMLDELLNSRQLMGCALMLAGMILSQLATPASKTERRQSS